MLILTAMVVSLSNKERSIQNKEMIVMLKKRIAMGILAGLLACSFIAGCGGGDKGTSEPPKPKPIAADLKDLPNKDVKVGINTFKLFTLKIILICICKILIARV